MITSQDALDIQKALNAAVASGALAPARKEQIIDRIIAMIPAPPKTEKHCTKCGRGQSNPDNVNCDMQPCTFV